MPNTRPKRKGGHRGMRRLLHRVQRPALLRQPALLQLRRRLLHLRSPGHRLQRLLQLQLQLQCQHRLQHPLPLPHPHRLPPRRLLPLTHPSPRPQRRAATEETIGIAIEIATKTAMGGIETETTARTAMVGTTATIATAVMGEHTRVGGDHSRMPVAALGQIG